MINKEKTSVLFVCLGNICRSPTAHGVFRAHVERAGLAAEIEIDSAGTAAYHVGNAPDQRSASTALLRGYDLSDLRARQAERVDFNRFDYILAMDKQNLSDLRAICPVDYSGHLGLFLDLASDGISEVPDPYYGGPDCFDHVLDLVEGASFALLQRIRDELGRS